MRIRTLSLPLLMTLSACGVLRRGGGAPAAESVAGAMVPGVAEAAAMSEADVRFLASDELLGRDTPSPGLDSAAAYIARAFAAAGVETVPGASGYRQPVQLVSVAPPAGSLELGGRTLVLGEDASAIGRAAASLSEVPLVYAGYGADEALDSLDVAGKLVVTESGSPDESEPFGMFGLAQAKRAAVAERGGLALVELYRSPRAPWQGLMDYLMQARMTTAQAYAELEAEGIPLLWVSDGDAALSLALRDTSELAASAAITAGVATPIASANVVGLVRGADPTLREEYVAITAHYDHVGTGARPGATDTIFNGARDNALGTAALLAAARTLAADPPRRSVLLLAVTAEEKGLLGSKAFVEDPLVPLERVVFDLNFDGAGYDDTSALTVIGLDRTSARPLIEAGARAAGLGASDDPAPEQNLYDRSDNVRFAAAGVPAVNVAPGMTGFSEAVMQYYHQPADNPESLDYDYVARYAEAAARIARAIADAEERPRWTPGDKYEAAGRELYGTD